MPDFATVYHFKWVHGVEDLFQKSEARTSLKKFVGMRSNWSVFLNSDTSEAPIILIAWHLKRTQVFFRILENIVVSFWSMISQLFPD